MSPEQGVSTGILISIGGIFGAAIIGLLASRMKIFYALSLFLGLTSACVFPICCRFISSSIALMVGLLLGTLINGCVAGLYSISPTIYDAEFVVVAWGMQLVLDELGQFYRQRSQAFFWKGIAPPTLYAYYGVVLFWLFS